MASSKPLVVGEIGAPLFSCGPPRSIVHAETRYEFAVESESKRTLWVAGCRWQAKWNMKLQDLEMVDSNFSYTQ